MADERLPPQAFLRECFSYDPETGEVRWKRRPDSHFQDAGVALGWNNRQAGALAFQSVNRGYRQCEVVYEGRRCHLRAHSTIWKLVTGEEPEMVDHRDLDTLNNRFANLRASDRYTNRFNAPGSRKHPLPKGVHFRKGRFVAKGAHKGKKHHLGCFSTPAEAHEAYCAWASPIHGEFFNAGPDKPSVFN